MSIEDLLFFALQDDDVAVEGLDRSIHADLVLKGYGNGLPVR